MSLEFYLFDVDHGQSAAIRLPHGEWCLFDAGRTNLFSPTNFVRGLTGRGGQFRYYKATISHWHGDHLADYEELFRAAPQFIRTVNLDAEFINDVRNSSHPDSFGKIQTFGNHFLTSYGVIACADYGPFVSIQELSLLPAVARHISSSANSAVNNASVVSRISCYGHSILICGDMESEGWDYALNHSPERLQWQQLVSNVKVLVAPHHGHSSAYSTHLMRYANPEVVIVSVKSGDEHVDQRYSAIEGIRIGDDDYKMITTRQKGSIKISVNTPTTLLSSPTIFWQFDADGRRAAIRQQIISSFIRQPTFNPFQ